MPAKVIKRRVAQRIGKGSFPGTAEQTANGKQRGPVSPGADAIVADSIHTLRLKPKSGTDVFFSFEDNVDREDWNRVVHAAWDAYVRSSLLVKGETITTKAGDMPLSVALYCALTKMKAMLPSGFELNLVHDENKDKYFVTFYTECPWNYGWNYFSVGPTLLKLNQDNRRLHDLFIVFLKAVKKTGISLWWDGLFLDTAMLREHMDEMDDGPEKDEYFSQINRYGKGGVADRYKKLIKNAKDLSFQEIQRLANRYKPGEPISNLIYQGCEVFKAGYNFIDFCRYLPHESFLHNIFLELEHQITVVWDEEDVVTREHMDYIDSIAQEGVHPPITYLSITADTKEIDFMKMRDKAAYPTNVYRFFQRAAEIIKKYTYERKNKRAAVRV